MRNDLPALRDAGVCSVKLEGRLKRPEYVAQVAQSYRKGIDSLDTGFAPADGAERDALLQIFQRGGFMRGYAMGCEDAGVIYPERVSHCGVDMGRLQSVRNGFAEFSPTRALHNGDQLQFRGSHRDEEMIYSGPEIPAGAAARLRLRDGMVLRPGDEVFRLTDAQQLAEMNELPMPVIPVDMELYAFPGQPIRLTITDGASRVIVQGQEVQPAASRAMTEADAQKSLGRLGDTCFALHTLTVRTENAFVPVSVLNALRREAA